MRFFQQRKIHILVFDDLIAIRPSAQSQSEAMIEVNRSNRPVHRGKLMADDLLPFSSFKVRS